MKFLHTRSLFHFHLTRYIRENVSQLSCQNYTFFSCSHRLATDIRVWQRPMKHSRRINRQYGTYNKKNFYFICTVYIHVTISINYYYICFFPPESVLLNILQHPLGRPLDVQGKHRSCCGGHARSTGTFSAKSCDGAQLSPCATTTEPTCCSYWSPRT